MFNRIRLFIRQPFTETRSKNELNRVFSIIDNYKKYPLEILPYKSAGESSDFKSIFEKNLESKNNQLEEYKKSETAKEIESAFPDAKLIDITEEE